MSRLKTYCERERKEFWFEKIEQLSLDFACCSATAFFSAEDDIEDSHALIACHAGFGVLVLVVLLAKSERDRFHHRRRHDRLVWTMMMRVLAYKLCLFLYGG